MKFVEFKKQPATCYVKVRRSTLLYAQLVKIAVLCCKYGGRRLILASTTPATPLIKAYQCGFFYV